LGILTCIEYKKFDLASHTATTSRQDEGVAKLQSFRSVHRKA
jgi:hypothetical protein